MVLDKTMNTLELYSYFSKKIKSGINRTIMAQSLVEVGLKYGVEIGVAEGMHSKVLLDVGCDIFGVDCYQKYLGYEEYKNPEDMCEKMLKFLSPYGDQFRLIKKFSIDAVKEFAPNAQIDFVYIDGGHDFLNVAQDIALWAPLVKPGGIVFGHDFKHRAKRDGKRYSVHVKPVVEAYMAAYDIKSWFILPNDIKDPTFGHDNPGWMFIREEGQL